MIEVIVLKQFQKFVKVKNGTPFKNSLFFYFMLIQHLNNVEHGVTIREPVELVKLIFGEGISETADVILYLPIPIISPSAMKKCSHKTDGL